MSAHTTFLNVNTVCAVTGNEDCREVEHVIKCPKITAKFTPLGLNQTARDIIISDEALAKKVTLLCKLMSRIPSQNP